MKKALAIILTIICGLLANSIAAVPAVSVLLTEESVVFGFLLGLLIAYGIAALLNLIGRKLEEKRIIARWALLLIAQAPFVIMFAVLFFSNAVALHNYEPSPGDMWSGMYGWGLDLGYCVYLGALATAVMTTAAAFIIFAVNKKKSEA